MVEWLNANPIDSIDPTPVRTTNEILVQESQLGQGLEGGDIDKGIGGGCN